MSTNNRDKSCKDRIEDEWEIVVKDLSKLFTAMDSRNQKVSDEALRDFNSYALSFDYVGANTFDDQPDGYFRYQISWGGPSDEIRYYITNGERPYKINYHFMDWYDGVEKDVTDEEIALKVWEYYSNVIDINKMIEDSED